MSIINYNPVRELLSFEKDMSKMFKDFESALGFKRGKVNEELENAVWSPLTDICESENEYSIKVDLPGMVKDDVKITYSNGTLAISGERRQESETKDSKYHRVERIYGKFYRSFNLPDYIDHNKIEAEFKNGQLEIKLPKTDEAKPKLLEIKVK